MQSLIANGRRVLVLPTSHGSIVTDTWADLYGGASVAEISEHLLGQSRTAQAGRELWMFSVFRAPKAGDDVSCIKDLARATNALVPDDSALASFESEDKRCLDEGCGCMRYRSSVEVAHQNLLGKGHGVFSLLVDHSMLGDVASTARRMNEANLRHFKGLPEPSESCSSSSTTTTTTANTATSAGSLRATTSATTASTTATSTNLMTTTSSMVETTTSSVQPSVGIPDASASEALRIHHTLMQLLLVALPAFCVSFAH
eukprot:TRINITY_DN74718_c0_g1_i1.p1 TRINITY_DN74718_c0_g1~~TRINITY_DN74718_c0_g1_i1.p1  ORF type:complete len:258 (-),score=28.56 TRINITY_DN74718_c0_g1_i1:101-874(-)